MPSKFGAVLLFFAIWQDIQDGRQYGCRQSKMAAKVSVFTSSLHSY